jgi:hypothetical protein
MARAPRRAVTGLSLFENMLKHGACPDGAKTRSARINGRFYGLAPRIAPSV